MSGAAERVAAVHLRSYAARAEAHAHDFHQLVLPLVGCLELEIGGHGGRVAGPIGALVAPGERHAFSAPARNQLLVLDLPHALVEETGALEWLDRSHRARFFQVSRAAARLATWFAEELGGSGAPPMVANAFATLLLRAASGPPSPPLPAAVQRALAFIDGAALHPTHVADVARAAGVSPGHLHALFRAHVGRSPRSLARTRRLAEARRLLVETALPIVEVALRCGFADQPSLTHAMRRALGTTPGRLRRPRS